MAKKIGKKIIKEKKSEKKTGKKINENAILIKKILDKKIRQKDIAKKFNISKQKVNYWKRTEIKTEIHRRLKLNQEYIDQIIKLAENKTTSEMSFRKIANIMNKKFEKEGKETRISRTTITKYLKNHFGTPRKMKKVFTTNDKKKEERIKFCQKVLDLNLKGKDLFFTDESQMVCNPFVNEHIRLSPENQEKMKNGDNEAFNMVNKQADKFPKKISFPFTFNSSIFLQNFILSSFFLSFVIKTFFIFLGAPK